MTRIFNGTVGGLGLAAVILCVLPIAESVGAAPPVGNPGQINREFKTDRLMAPRSAAKKITPVRILREQPAPVTERAEKPELKDGCEPLFSPVTMPTLAHLPGRCIG